MQELKITFNKKAQKPENDSTCQIVGNIVKVKVEDRAVHLKFGINDNYHEFYILRVPFEKSFFHTISQNVTLKRNGDIVIDVPDELDDLKLGQGSNLKDITYNASIQWDNDTSLTLRLD